MTGTQALEQGFVGILVALAYGYFFMYLFYIGRAYYVLRGLPYSQYKCVALPASRAGLLPVLTWGCWVVMKLYQGSVSLWASAAVTKPVERPWA